MTETKHLTVKSVFIGEIHRKDYYCTTSLDYRYEGSSHERHYYMDKLPQIQERNLKIGEERFFECDFDVPRLDIGEVLYINELDITVRVERKMRSTHGETVYHVTHVIRVEQNDETFKSLEKANEEYRKYSERFNMESDERINEMVNKKLAEAKKDTWFHKLFGKGSIKL